MSSKPNQTPPALGIGEFRGKGVATRKSAPHGNTGVGSRAKSTKND